MRNTLTKLLVLISIIVLVSAFWWIAKTYVEHLFPLDPNGAMWVTRSQFGSMFGAISSLMTALNLAFLVYAILFQAKETERNNEIRKWEANYTYVLDAKKLITDHPEILELHGLPTNLPQELGVTPAQVAYVILDLKAADLYYRIDERDPIKMTDYRLNLLKNDKYRKIARSCLVDGKLLPESRFTKALSSALTDSQNACSTHRTQAR